jgi:hypothetical protein
MAVDPNQWRTGSVGCGSTGRRLAQAAQPARPRST